MSFKYVTVAASLPIGGTAEKPDLLYTMLEGVTFRVDNSPSFSKPQSSVRAGARIIKAFDGAAAGSVVELKEEDWRALNADVEAGETPWGFWTVTADEKRVQLHVPPRYFLPFSNAVNEAKNQRDEA